MMQMGYFSIWPIVFCTTVFFGIASTPLLQAADAPPNDKPKRALTLDGLRGFLALAVVFHHGAIYHGYLETGVWKPSPSNLYTGLGEGGVSMFFMVTGYLFWRKILTEQGKSGVNWIALAIGRVFRIGPVYWLATIPTLAIVGWLTGWTLDEPSPLLVRDIIKMFSLGVFHMPEVNGYHNTNIILAGVTWSLRYEWAFYGALPFLALILKAGSSVHSMRKTLPWLLPGVAFIGCMAATPEPDDHGPAICAALFCVGMFAAACKPVSIGPGWLQSTIVLLLVAAAVTLFPSSFEVGPVTLLGAAFILITSGCTVFGALTTRPAIRLGDISYGIYLLQGLTLAGAYWPPTLGAFARSGPIAHWLLFLLSTSVLIAVATAAHVYLERPGIETGRRVVNYLRARSRLAA